MLRAVVPLVIATGCVSIDSTPPPSASEPPSPHVHLAIDVFGNSHVALTLLDGTVVDHAYFERGYAKASEIPVRARLPIEILFEPLVISLGHCADGDRDLVFQHVSFGSLQMLDDASVYGHLDFQCTYADGSTRADTANLSEAATTLAEPL
jgi:hypothetical protein